ncbi:MAG: cysteine--tRNA ligase [Nitrolancea sp.]
MPLRLSDTLTGEKRDFETIEPGRVRMYVCGPTVYSDAHIGHAMSAIVFDVIRRYLEYSGFQVEHVQNFTDIDDKVIQRAATLGIEPEALAQRLIDEWHDETAELNVLPATAYPRATQEVDTIINMIEGLIKDGNAYPAAHGDVFFRVNSFPGYGKLSHRDLEQMLPGARIEVDPNKEDAMDFVLWKSAKPGEPAWDSPWGPGRPGWHIECSAMIYHLLGARIDIHGGGSDLIFPHHENEIAQSEAFTHAAPMANFWVHNGMLQLGGEKMSKSVGNLVSIRQILENSDGQAFRFLVLNSHYRNPLVFNDETLESARRGLARMASALRDFDTDSVPASAPDHLLSEAAERAETQFREGMDDDFSTPVALSALFELARTINREEDAGAPTAAVSFAQARLKRLAGVLGLTLSAPRRDASVDIEPFVDMLLEVRQELRSRKQWDLADSIRTRLEELGVRLEDTSSGSVWRRP